MQASQVGELRIKEDIWRWNYIKNNAMFQCRRGALSMIYGSTHLIGWGMALENIVDVLIKHRIYPSHPYGGDLELWYLISCVREILNQRHGKYITEYKVLRSTSSHLEASYDYCFKIFPEELNKFSIKIEIQRQKWIRVTYSNI